jgi:hypothetical protein
MSNPYKEYTPPASEGGLFFKFEDDKQYDLRLLTEPVVFNTFFKDKVSGEETTSTKYAWLAWDSTEKAVKVVQLPVTGYQKVAAYAADDEWGDPTRYNLKMKRFKKANGFYDYDVVPSPNKTDVPEAVKEAAAPHDLKKLMEDSEYNSNVTWLSDAIGGGKKAEDHSAAHKANDVIMDVDSDEPIDLSSIPF